MLCKEPDKTSHLNEPRGLSETPCLDATQNGVNASAKREVVWHDEAEADGAQLAERVVKLFNTRDVFKLAASVGARLVYARWACVTIGEYCAQTRSISVNLAAIEEGQKRLSADAATARSLAAFSSDDALRQVIIAHELGHLFDEMLNGQNALKANDKHREGVAHGFATRLLELPFNAAAYEKLWQRLKN